MNDLKVYVDVIVSFRNDGVMLPRQITWEDGHKYEIDRVSDIRPAAAARAGGQGIVTQCGSTASKVTFSLKGTALSPETISADGS